MAPAPPAGIVERLSDLGKRVLKAAVLSGMSTEKACSFDDLRGQLSEADSRRLHDALTYLQKYQPPLVTRGSGPGYLFTYEGAIVARLVMTERFPQPPSAGVTPFRLRSQAEIDRQMEEHADTVGGTIWKGAGVRCSNCRHEERYGIKKGARRLCQVCFVVRGIRFAYGEE